MESFAAAAKKKTIAAAREGSKYFCRFSALDDEDNDPCSSVDRFSSQRTQQLAVFSVFSCQTYLVIRSPSVVLMYIDGLNPIGGISA